MFVPVALPPLKLPTEYGLPYDEDRPRDRWDELLLVELLLDTLSLTRHDRKSTISNRNFVYYEAAPTAYPLLPKQSGSDLFVVPDTTPELRRSRVRWSDGR